MKIDPHRSPYSIMPLLNGTRDHRRCYLTVVYHYYVFFEVLFAESLFFCKSSSLPLPSSHRRRWGQHTTLQLPMLILVPSPLPLGTLPLLYCSSSSLYCSGLSWLLCCFEFLSSVRSLVVCRYKKWTFSTPGRKRKKPSNVLDPTSKHFVTVRQHVSSENSKK